MDCLFLILVDIIPDFVFGQNGLILRIMGQKYHFRANFLAQFKIKLYLCRRFCKKSIVSQFRQT